MLVWRPGRSAPTAPNSLPATPGIPSAYPDTGFPGFVLRTQVPVRTIAADPAAPRPLRVASDWRRLTPAEHLADSMAQRQTHAFLPPRGYLADYMDTPDGHALRLAQDTITPDEDLLLAPGSTPPLAPPPVEAPAATPVEAPPQTPPLPQTAPHQLPEAMPAPPIPTSPPKAPSSSETAPGTSTPQSPSPSDLPSEEQLPSPAIPPRAVPEANPGSTVPAPQVPPTAPPGPAAVDPHADVFAQGPYPSARACRACHEQIYDEWASSSHAYASISPMFHKFEQTITNLSQGTIGYFCMRCHSPVGTSLGLNRAAPIYTSVPAATEGVTCVACHRVIQSYGKVNGQRRIEPGSIWDPMVGAGDGAGLREVLARKEEYKVKDQPGQTGPGQNIHAGTIQFEQIASSHFCVSCHQVAVYPGITLEVVWAQYRASPAHAQGIACQECHMGREPGLAHGYETGPAAVVNQKPVNPHRKHSNHAFFGPGYSIAHPGIFPHHPKADRWKIPEWLQFDWRAGWGTEAFEEALDEGRIQGTFPEVWKDAEDRADAREIIDENLKALNRKRELRREVMENGSALEGPTFVRPPTAGKALHFKYRVRSQNSGHNLPSGSLGAQPQLWLNVALSGPDGRTVWESGYVDANGDVGDVQSLEVAAGRTPRDLQLFNLQTKFLITHVKGTDREMSLPINVDVDQLPFIRPSGFPITVMNHPPQIRMEAHSVPPLGVKTADYHVPAHLLRTPGTYRLSVRMRSRAEPIYFMRFCRATPEMERSMNEWMLDFHEQAVEFEVR